MQRHEMMKALTGLGLKGMAGAFDEAVTTGLQRKRTTMEILTDLLRAETSHRHAASVRYRMTAARLPAVKDIDALRLRRHTYQRRAGALAAQRIVSARPAQCRARRRYGHRQDTSRQRHHCQRGAGRRPRAVFQHGRSGQPARGRDAPWQGWYARRAALPSRPRSARRARLPAVCALGRGNCSSI